jgi:two-component system, OmpR family, KDP operon response regulator KdpE
MTTHKILVVEDEPKTLRLLVRNLDAGGYAITAATTGAQALDLAAVAQPDLVILDVALPDMDGFEVCRRLREFTSAPILMLTARAREVDKLTGFRAGADDYITKPFSVNELMARIGAALRRIPDAAYGPAVIRVGRLTLDLPGRQTFLNGDPLALTPTEFKLLSHLVVNRGKVVAHEDLLRKVWGPEYVDNVDYLRVYIWHLRRKLEGGTDDGKLIKTVPGVGYTIPEDETT